MLISRNPRALRIAVVGTALGLAIAACGGGGGGAGGGAGGANQASAPGVTATTITLGTTQPVTGPAAPGYSEIAPAADAMFKWANAHGGVNGRTIKLLIEDDGYNPANTATLTRKLVLQDQVFVDFDPLGTPTQLSVQAFLNSQKVPQLFIASGCTCWNQPDKFPWSFGWQTNYIIEGKILGKYIHDKLAGQKVGYIYQDDDFGKDGVKGLDQQVPSSDVVGRQTYDVTTLTHGLANQVSALKNSGAQVVGLFTIPAATALTLLAAAQIGYHPTWVSSNVGADPPTLTKLLQSFSKGVAGASLLDGMVASYYLTPYGVTSDPWVAFFKQVLQAYDPGAPYDGNTQYGLAVGYTMVQLLKAAGQNPTRQSLVNTLESQGGSLGGPGLEPFAYSHTNHYGYQGEVTFTIQNGVATNVSPVSVSTNDGPITTSDYKQPSPPSF